MAAIVEHARKYKDEALNLYKQAEAILDEYEGKDIPADKLKQSNALFDEGRKASDRAEAEQKRAEAEVWKELPDDTRRMEVAEIKHDDVQARDASDRVFEKYGLRRWEINGIKQSVRALNNAFEGSRKQLLTDRGIEYKTLTESGSTSGATLTPDIFVPEFINKLYLNSHLRQAGARIVPLRSDVTKYPKMTTASGAATLIAELAAATATNATVGEATFTAYMYRALQQASMELVADAEFDILSTLILPDMAQQFASAENLYFTTGTGSGQPEGIVTGIVAGSGNTRPTTVGWATSASIAFDDVINLMHQPPPQYRVGNTCFMGHDDVVKTLRKVKAVSGGTYIWEPSQQVGQPDMLYGRPIYYNQAMTTAVTAGVYPLLYGNMDYFWIGDRAGLDVRPAYELFLANAQVAWFAFKRFDSRTMQNEAFAILKGS